VVLPGTWRDIQEKMVTIEGTNIDVFTIECLKIIADISTNAAEARHIAPDTKNIFPMMNQLPERSSIKNNVNFITCPRTTANTILQYVAAHHFAIIFR
jgi:hypothetical protein